MPKPPTINPPPHRHAAVTPTQRGPTSSSHLPAIAAAKPRNTMATENIQTTSQTFNEIASENNNNNSFRNSNKTAPKTDFDIFQDQLE